MSWTPISGTAPQYSTDDNNLAQDYWLKFYDAGTTNAFAMSVDADETQTLSKCKLNAEGYPITDPLNDNTVFIPHIDRDYRIVLYKSEADADADNTVNAAFNIDGIQQEVTQIATAADVTTRNTTLQVQDDYDRSPLFNDGTDFTAGAGPHVITVPSGWVPSSAETRFYKLDASGIVTILTPTAKDATTFTLTETLLSTDTIFIGDNKFRNQVDGDPADSRDRLNVYSKEEVYSQAESFDLFLNSTSNLNDLHSLSAARHNLDVYSKDEIDAAIAYSEVSSSTASGTWSITGLRIGKPLVITASSASGFTVSASLKAISGTNDAAVGESSHFFKINSDVDGDPDGGTNPSFSIIPTATTVSFTVIVGANTTLRAYQ